jgi:hypothetical protein
MAIEALILHYLSNQFLWTHLLKVIFEFCGIDFFLNLFLKSIRQFLLFSYPCRLIWDQNLQNGLKSDKEIPYQDNT